MRCRFAGQATFKGDEAIPRLDVTVGSDAAVRDMNHAVAELGRKL
jgi:hypothetical protein